METYICGRGFAIKESAILGFTFCGGKVFVMTPDKEPQPADPYSPDDLRQLIWDGKLDAGDLGGLGSGAAASSNSNVPKYDAEVPARLFLVYGREGNVKLCRARDFIFITLTGENDAAIRTRVDVWVNNSATIGNVRLGICDSDKDVG